MSGWLRANAESHRAATREWTAANKERKDAYNAQYRETRRAEAAARAKVWYFANKLKVHERSRVRQWAKHIVDRAKESAKARGHEHDITESYILELFEKQGGRCHWTGVPMVPSTVTRDPQRPTIDRIDNAVGYVAGNVVMACLFANTGRGAAPAARFREFMVLVRESIGSAGFNERVNYAT